MEKSAKIFVAGHRGLVGSALVENLTQKGYTNLICVPHSELDLTDTLAVAEFFSREKPEYVFLAAAKVGGIQANNCYRAEFIHENLMIQTNVIHQSYLQGVKKLLFLGSTCIYPANAPQPMNEESLLTSPLEYTNEPYAIAKIAGMKMCEAYNMQYGTNFIAVMPTNLYGIRDNFDLETSHVVPALIRKMPKREFMYNDDMADACVYVMERIDFNAVAEGKEEVRNTHINIGTGEEISIASLALLIRDIVGFKGELVFDTTKPDGMMLKRTDVSKLHALGWKARTSLKEGLERVYRSVFLNENLAK